LTTEIIGQDKLYINYKIRLLTKTTIIPNHI